MWGKQGSIEVIDLGNKFFIVKSFSQEDLDFALTGGPWKIFDHYLAIRFWKPNFNPIEATINSIATWVRLLGLAIEYYKEEMLKRIGSILGKTMRVDTNTADKSRGKFARLYVELDLTEPLVSQYSINGIRYLVEYEGLHSICFQCGLVGHDSNCCPRKVVVNGASGAVAMAEKESDVGEKQVPQNDKNKEGNNGKNNNNKGKKVIKEEDGAYGPWMMVQRTNRGKKAGKV
ncbi:uncharacterized protein [Arachis hypogaea]|uniref:uncharacterized protein n=1 Tax=Arachis hypogaea TaxID=3818 RepID=UPI000DECA5A8|nr:uncharacterized protein LOC112792804 [Arachis hypogaea]